MPQTRFVTRKALALGLRPSWCQQDRSAGCDPEGAVNDTFDLFCALGASDEQLDFPVVYASGRDGYAVKNLKDERKDLAPMLDLVVQAAPPPLADMEAPWPCTWPRSTMTTISVTWRSVACSPAASARANAPVHTPRRQARRISGGQDLGYQSLKRFELQEAVAGDICAITGMQDLTVGETITEILRPSCCLY